MSYEYSPAEVTVAMELWRYNYSAEKRAEIAASGDEEAERAYLKATSEPYALLDLSPSLLGRYVATALALYGEEASDRLYQDQEERFDDRD